MKDTCDDSTSAETKEAKYSGREQRRDGQTG
jgi:hypothetical protein